MSLRDDLIRDEGCKLTSYLCPAGIATVGYGHTGPEIHLGMTITQAQAENYLEDDIDKHHADLLRAFPWAGDLPSDVQRGLENMCFNLGLPRLSGFHNMLAALRARDWEKASSEALSSAWAAQVGDRAKRIAELFRGPHGP